MRKSQSKAPTTQNGFTMLELLIVVAIAGILGALAAPNFVNLIKNNRLTSKSNEVMHGISLARQTAIGKSVVTFVCHTANADTVPPSCAGGTSSNWSKGYIIYNAPSNTLVASERTYANGTDALIGQSHLSSTDNIAITSATNANTDNSDISGNDAGYISFRSDGTLFSDNPVTLQICDDRPGANGNKVRINTAGQISMRPYTCP